MKKKNINITKSIDKIIIIGKKDLDLPHVGLEIKTVAFLNLAIKSAPRRTEPVPEIDWAAQY